MNRTILWSVVGFCLCYVNVAIAQQAAKNPLALSTGPHLLLDDYLIAKSEGIERKVVQPTRVLKEPVVNGSAGHQNWQPFFTVLHDPTLPIEKRFRMWYNVDTVDDPTDGEFFGATGLLESADGIHWPGPYQRLTSLTSDGRLRIGASVVDEGPQGTPAAERYKIMFYDSNKLAGPRVAFSPDGVNWTMHNEGKPALVTGDWNDIWTMGYDPIRTRYYLISKLLEPYTWTNAEGEKLTESIRRCQTSFSSDCKTWSTPKPIFSPDEKDLGITQWYGAAGFQRRGDLIVGFLRELRDELSPEGAPQEAIDANTGGHAGLGSSNLKYTKKGSGIGYTVLMWSHDGETWHRDRYTDKFLEPDPKVGAWDHAMAWVGSTVPVDDEVYLYYVGYRWGHKHRHSVDRQIGMVKVMRDRYVARRAGANGGTLTTPLITLGGNKLTLNADATEGELRVQVLDVADKPIPGLTFADCRPIRGDSLNAAVQWEAKSLADFGSKPVRLEFSLKNASLFAFELEK